MKTDLYNLKAEVVGSVELPSTVFGLESNNDLLHQVVASQISNKRQVIAHAKGRGEVRGGGKKPWRQKGTGRARHGSIRSPIWKGGGATHGPTKEADFKKKINRKAAKKALFVALSEKVRDNSVLVLDKFELENGKSKEVSNVLKNFSSLLGKNPNTLLVLPNVDAKVVRAVKNMKEIASIEARNLNPLEVLSHKKLILVKDSINVLEQR